MPCRGRRGRRSLRRSGTSAPKRSRSCRAAIARRPRSCRPVDADDDRAAIARILGSRAISTEHGASWSMCVATERRAMPSARLKLVRSDDDQPGRLAVDLAQESARRAPSTQRSVIGCSPARSRGRARARRAREPAMLCRHRGHLPAGVHGDRRVLDGDRASSEPSGSAPVRRGAPPDGRLGVVHPQHDHVVEDLAHGSDGARYAGLASVRPPIRVRETRSGVLPALRAAGELGALHADARVDGDAAVRKRRAPG